MQGFNIKQNTVDDKVLYLTCKEKEELAKLLTNDDLLSEIMVSIWNLYVSISSCYISNNKVHINIPCDNLSYPLVNKIVNNMDRYNISCRFKYYNLNLNFLFEFDYLKSYTILKLLSDKFFELNDSVDAVFNLSHKVDNEISFDVYFEKSEAKKVIVKDIKDNKSKFKQYDLKDINYILETIQKIPEGNYTCNGESLKSVVDSIKLKRDVELYFKHTDLFGYNNPFEILSLSKEQKEFLAFNFCEGNKELKDLLSTLWDKKIATIGCCSGHYFESNEGIYKSTGKAYFGFLLNNVEAVNLANYITNLVQEISINDIDCFVFSNHTEGYMAFSIHISRKYSAKLFGIINNYISKIDENSAVPYNFLVGLITELHVNDNTNYSLAVRPNDELILNIDSPYFQKEISLKKNIQNITRNKQIEKGSYACNTDILSEFVKVKRKK